jgi:hypothetical protein
VYVSTMGEKRHRRSLGPGLTFWWAALGTYVIWYLALVLPYIDAGGVGVARFAVVASAAAALGVGLVYRTVRRHEGSPTASGSTTAMLALIGWLAGALQPSRAWPCSTRTPGVPSAMQPLSLVHRSFSGVGS